MAANENTPRPRILLVTRPGPSVVIVILGLGLMAACFAWWYRHSLGHRTAAHWGGQDGMRIRYADRVELYRVTSAPRDADMIVELQAGERWYLFDRRDISRTKGIQNARQSLVEDASFDWDLAPANPATSPVWTYALCFHDYQGMSRILIDADGRALLLVDRASTPLRSAPIAQALQGFLQEQYAQGQAQTPASDASTARPRP